ncbi:hypothetical protein G1C95_0314 [Bifidobacterium sp. DSM 109957]|uniref:PemK-like protein n=2 Tax=Bifidobacterium oedipodis TaxID=2675322 RepID=A0A7Y0EMS2_9BIFI|nr:hypothetical protein [Bifidobacterium sp. DSM 109957]
MGTRSFQKDGKTTMTDVRPWQVRRVWFPFRENPNKGKNRRVVVKEVTDDNCVVIYVTSKVEKSNFPDFMLLKDWNEEGFDRASAVRWNRLLKVPISALGEHLGDLSPYDRLELQMRYQFR